MTRLSHTRAEIEALSARILSALQAQAETTVQELSTKLGFGVSGIRTKLLDLEHRGLAHFVARRTHGNLGNKQFWRAGPAPARVRPLSQACVQPALEQLARTLSAQPVAGGFPAGLSAPPPIAAHDTEHRHRDPLVAALFGPAQGARP